MITYRRPAYASEDRMGVFRKEVPVLDWVNHDFLSSEMGRMWGRRPPSAELARYAAGSNLFLGSDAFFSKALGGSVLVDLGAGDPLAMLGFASRHGASGYIAVDVAEDYSMLQGIRRARFINDDMLRFLFHIEDSRVNVCMNAIDELVLRSESGFLGDLYASKLSAEIARVTRQGGIAFGLASPVLHRLGDLGLERLGEAGCAPVSSFGAVYLKG
jgi:hypothetical protein